MSLMLMLILLNLNEMAVCVVNVQRLGANAAFYSKRPKREAEYSCRGRYDAEEGQAARNHLACALDSVRVGRQELSSCRPAELWSSPKTVELPKIGLGARG